MATQMKNSLKRSVKVNESNKMGNIKKQTLPIGVNKIFQVTPTNDVIKTKTFTLKEVRKSTKQKLDAVESMVRPMSLMTADGCMLPKIEKFFKSRNKDFLVIGVIGLKGVGKSTILNLLANDKPYYDYHRRVFVCDNGIFPSKFKSQKWYSNFDSDSLHFYITQSRKIIIDTPPVIESYCNKLREDTEMKDLRNVITLMSTCHLLIVVQQSYVNFDLMRLLILAEMLKAQDNSGNGDKYFPNLLFIKNRATNCDYSDSQRQLMDHLLTNFVKKSSCRIYRGQAHKDEIMSAPIFNSLLFPDVTADKKATLELNLPEIIKQLRKVAFMTPRVDLCSNNVNGLTELEWLNYFNKVRNNVNEFLKKTFEDVRRGLMFVPDK